MAPEAWLLLIHQLPPKPPYLRVKVWRRLQALGAVALKNSVYVLPNTEETREDFEWIVREIQKERGEASLCEARLVEGLTDEEVRGLFMRAREADYRALAGEIRAFVHETLPSRGRSVSEEARSVAEAGLARFRKRRDDVARIDFFGAPGHEVVDGLITGVEERVSSPATARATPAARSWSVDDVRGRTWVTRKGVHIDRIACGWLVRRFIDPEAAFRFVSARGYVPGPRELRFDMFDAEFTHDGDRCSFEVMLDAFTLDDVALRAVGDVVHDVDLKDAKFSREETPGIEHLIAGIAWSHADDDARLEHGAAIFDALHQYFGRRTTAGTHS